MIIHAMDSLPAYEAVVNRPVSEQAGDRPRLDSSRMLALGDGISVTDTAVPVAAAGLCFVRPGAGGWSNLIAICDDGRISTLADVRRPALTPAVFHGSVGRTTATVRADAPGHWATWLSAALLSVGLALSVKFAAMTLGPAGQGRRFG